MDFAQQLRLWADELHSIADEQLSYHGDDWYVVHRMRRLQRVAAMVFAAQDAREADEVEVAFRGDLAHKTPYSGGDAGIIDEQGKILLIQRSDDHLWAMPGGLFEVGETPAEGVCREAFEETGLELDVRDLVGVYDSRLCGSRTNSQIYHFVFRCIQRHPEATPQTSPESLAVGWFEESGLPSLSPGHGRRIRDVFHASRQEQPTAFFDPVSRF